MTLVAVIKLLRLYYCLPLTAGYGVILWYVTQGSFQALPHTWPLALVSVFCVMAGGYALNDLWDRASDRINHPNRVLITGAVSPAAAGLICLVLLGVSLVCAAWCGTCFFVVMTLVAASLVIYDRWSKQWGLLKAMWVAMMVTSLYPLAWVLAGWGMGTRARVLVIHAVWLFLTAMGYEMLKDIRDIQGDALAGDTHKTEIRTRPWYRLILRSVLIGGALLTVMPWVLGYCRWVYGVTAVCAVLLACAAAFASIRMALLCVYVEVVLITVGSLVDALMFGF